LEARAYPGWFCQEGTRKKRIHPNLHKECMLKMLIKSILMVSLDWYDPCSYIPFNMNRKHILTSKIPNQKGESAKPPPPVYERIFFCLGYLA